jgi:hypothetical protein
MGDRSLIGLLGGPVGLAVGAVTGAAAGSLYDLAQLGVSEDFVAEVSRQLSPGKAAVIAEVDEEWITPLDARMEPLGGVVFRRSRGEFIDARWSERSQPPRRSSPSWKRSKGRRGRRPRPRSRRNSMPLRTVFGRGAIS